MKRNLIALLVATSSAAVAQENRMEHVIVSIPIHKKTAETNLPVTVLTGEELRRAATTSIGETLGNKPGIASASFGPGVGRPVIRGQQGARSVTLQNSTSSADVSSLSPDHAVGVEPLLADSIEVLRGPSTLLYGGGAIGGVVNVIDNRIPVNPIEGVSGAAEYRYDDASSMDSGVGRLDFGTGNFAFHLSGSTRDFDDLDIPGKAIDEEALEQQEELLGIEHEGEEEELENTNGYIANTDGDADIWTVGASYHLGDKGFFGLSASSYETNYGIPPGAHGHEEHEEDHDDDHDEDHDEEHGEEEEETIRIDLDMDRYDAALHLHDLLPGLIDIARVNVTYTDYEHVELEGAEVGTRFNRDTWESRIELVHTGKHNGVVGLQTRMDEFEAVGEEAYVPKTDSSEVGLFWVEDLDYGDWHIELGARVDWVERDPDALTADEEDFTSFSASGSSGYAFSDAWSASVALSRSARAPATEELFSNIDNTGESLVTHAATGAIEVGDADLDEETSINIDASLNWQGDQSWAELTVFFNTFQDYIFLLNSGQFEDETPIYLYEQDDADFVGAEFESSFYLTELGPGSLMLGVFGDMISGEFDSAGDVPRMPPLRIGSELSWSGDAFNAFVRVINADDQDDAGDFETDTDGYTRWDAGVDYSFNLYGDTELLTFIKWKNIGDEEIRLSTSFLRNYAPQAGESVEAGIRFSF
ncbi:MAG: TonB-dependent receptor [Halioglobus sp.]